MLVSRSQLFTSFSAAMDHMYYCMGKSKTESSSQEFCKEIYHCCNEIRIDYQCHTFHIIRFRTVIVRLLAYYYVIALP